MNTATTLTSVLTRLKEGDGHWQPQRTDENAAHALKMLRRVDRIAMTLFVTTGIGVLVSLFTLTPAAIITTVALGVTAFAAILYADHGTTRWHEAAGTRWVWHYDHRGC
jgi:hypothetical protein